ncbi:YycH family regulatory protein [Staphylococcus epidermidis]|uniref:YycH family regulatory protein n=1 Tax=Staphylococcus epidermidis TaxID=1282 RepID=UPI0021B2EC52|nr:YycH family regulatory protein [Staphylococcus epidermidis]
MNSDGGLLNEDYGLFKRDNRRGKVRYERLVNGQGRFNKEKLNEMQVRWGDKGV